MPTGYTYKVASGEITDFADFAKTCARAFGAAIHQRDDEADAPLKLTIERSGYYPRRLAEKREELTRWQTMPAEQVYRAREEKYQADLAYYRERLAEVERNIRRYRDMQEKVRLWQPPTPEHTGIKDFMLDQLNVSIQGEYAPDPPRTDVLAVPIEKYRASQIEQIKGEIAYHEEAIIKDEQGCAKSEAWLRALVASVEEK